MMHPVIIALTEQGGKLATTLADGLNGKSAGYRPRCDGLDHIFDAPLPFIQSQFTAGYPIIFIGACGIVIRAIAPFLSSKQQDPPVIVLDEEAQTILPLLGAHHGGIKLANAVKQITGGAIIFTSAGDQTWGVALDAPPEGWTLINPEQAKPVMARLLAGEQAKLKGEESESLADFLTNVPQAADGTVDLIASAHPQKLNGNALHYCPRRYVIGVGCIRDCVPDQLHEFVAATLEANNILPQAILAFGTIDLKEDEPAIRQLAETYHVPLRLFKPSELEAMTPELSEPSTIVYNEVGCHGVSEAAARLMAGENGSLVLPKQKIAEATLAIAKLPLTHNIVTDPTKLGGRATGKLMLVGIGPGQAAWRTPEADQALYEADLVLGYHYYLDLLKVPAERAMRFDLGAEEDRCRMALELAAEGKKIALVSSGDIGIYAMASLVYELCGRSQEAGGVSEAAKRIEIVTALGISAFQAAAALAGAPMGHDFCLISLSDLLTPRETILTRVKAAAMGDFVIAFYNPVSKKRTQLFDDAVDLLRANRPATTPVIIARQLGRPDQTCHITQLETLHSSQIDMFTLVIIGSSQTKTLKSGWGERCYTPRGYMGGYIENKESSIKKAQNA